MSSTGSKKFELYRYHYAAYKKNTVFFLTREKSSPAFEDFLSANDSVLGLWRTVPDEPREQKADGLCGHKGNQPKYETLQKKLLKSI